VGEESYCHWILDLYVSEMPYECDDCGMMFHELVSFHYHRLVQLVGS